MANDESDYRGFLRARLLEKGFSQAGLARYLVCSRSWVSLMLSGRRSLGCKLAPAVADYFRLEGDQLNHFLALVDVEENSSGLARAQAMTIIRSMAIRVSPEDLRQDALFVMEDGWYVAPVLQLAKCESFSPEPRWIAQMLNPTITPSQAMRALMVLSRAGLLGPEGRAEPGATIAPLFTSVQVPKRVSSPARLFHSHNMQLAATAGERFIKQERFLGSGCFALSEDHYDELLKEFEEAWVRVISSVKEDPDTPNRVYAFAVALFPMSEYTDSDETPSADGDP